MKLMAIMGSPRGMRGNTGKLLDPLLRAVADEGADVDGYSLNAMDVQPCRSCDLCHKTGNCAIRDDFAAAKEAMLECDGIILASPNYISSVTAQMKALMDRCCGLLHCQSMKGKYAVAVVTSGGPESPQVEEYILRFLRALGCTTVGSIGTEAWRLGLPADMEELANASAKLGRRLVEAIRTQEAFAEQDREHQATAERMRRLVELHSREWAYEYECWQGRRHR